MSLTDTRKLIADAVERLQSDVPALRQLALVARLELPAHGGGATTWRVEVPGPRIDHDPAGDARIEVSVPRSRFNELARRGRLKQWAEAYERGHVHVSGHPGVVKLLGSVMSRQLARSGS